MKKTINDLSEYEPPPTIEELLLKAKRKRRIPGNRLFFEKVRHQCILPLEQYALRTGQTVSMKSGISGILDIVISKLANGGAKFLTQEQREKGHKYFVSITSDVRGVISEDINTSGSTALEAMTAAMRELEDDLCPSVPPKKGNSQMTREDG